MRLQKVPIIALGLATLWPLIHVVVFAVSVSQVISHPETASAFHDGFFPILMVSHVVTILLALLLLPIYVAKVFALPPAHAGDRTLWMLVILFTNVLGMLVFFVRFELPRLGAVGNP